MIGGKGGRIIEALSPAEWLERRYEEIKHLRRDKGGRIISKAARGSPAAKHQVEMWGREKVKS